ncbi:SCP2 sterol-binding domain-containing protein [Pendulispora brunnea]|uniref:SCP2 sterol-binding domain-containing protein n=1 Tax=Pendulispora brunnea TaxID=2905690 RepID=A0ABZ2KK74_9BACT
MLPQNLPAGTTVESFFEDILPEAHRQLVPADASAGEYIVSIRMEGPGTGTTRYAYTIRGREISIARGADSPAQSAAHLWIAGEHAALTFFLEDWSGPRRFAPSFEPAQGVKLITDPRVLKRLAQATGKIELGLIDFEGGAGNLVLSAAGAKKHAFKDTDSDAVIETRVEVFEKLLAGKLGPDEAIADSHVTVRGKKLVAMQFAFALAPFFPAR